MAKVWWWGLGKRHTWGINSYNGLPPPRLLNHTMGAGMVVPGAVRTAHSKSRTSPTLVFALTENYLGNDLNTFL